MKKSSLIQIAKFFVGWPLSLLALFFLGRFITQNGSSVVTIFSSLNYVLLFFALLSFLGYFLLRGVFWHELLKKKGYTFSLSHSLSSWSIAEIKRYIPGNIWAVIDRARVYKEKGIPVKTTLAIQTQELLYMFVATILLSSLSVNFFIYGLLPHLPFQLFFAILIPLLLCIFTFIFICSKYILKQRILKRFPLLSGIVPAERVSDIVSLLVFMISAFVCFGLGTYFSISSLTLLFPGHVGSLVGFFAASFLLGFLSFITPMGLGVREGIITFGIAKYLFSLQKAATGALLARVVQVISELIFLLFVLAVIKIPEDSKKQLEDIWKNHKIQIILWTAIIIYICYFSTLSFLRYTNFYTGRFDLGNMDQTVWNTLHGRMFQLTDPDGTNIISRFAIHADFILILLTPLYFLWQDPRMLLLIQTLVLSLGAVFVFYLAKDIVKNKTTALILSICYLLNPALQHSNLYDFHAVVLATTFLLGAFYFLYKKKFFWFLLFGILAGLTKEEAWAVVGLLGWYDVFVNKQYIRGFLFFISGFGISYYLVDKLIPLVRGGDHFALSFYADLGTTPIGILRSVIFSPQKFLPILIKNGRPLYVFQLFFPLAFLSLFAPYILIFAGPDLFINLLSSNNQFHQIYLHYTATITPFLFIASIYGIRFIQKRFSFISLQTISVALLFTTILSEYFYGPLFGGTHPNLDMLTKPQANASEIEQFLTTIPKRLSVAATNTIGSHLSHRQKIYTIPVGIDSADVVVFLLNDQFAQPSLKAQKKMADSLTKNPDYVTVFEKGDFYVFEKKSLIHLKPLRREQQFPLLFSLSQLLKFHFM